MKTEDEIVSRDAETNVKVTVTKINKLLGVCLDLLSIDKVFVKTIFGVSSGISVSRSM